MQTLSLSVSKFDIYHSNGFNNKCEIEHNNSNQKNE